MGLLGSTAFGEEHADELSNNAIAYVNVDIGVLGPNFATSASPSLQQLLRQASTNITDPNTMQPLSKIWNQQVGRLGSGSDFTVFLDHLGVSSIDMGFQVGSYGVYHSMYAVYFVPF